MAAARFITSSIRGLLAMWMIVALAPGRAAAPLVVNATGDDDDGLCDTSHCSLREAIKAANVGRSSPATIHFAIASGSKQIVLKSPLPAVTTPIIIDGTTQPGFAGSPLIELFGRFAGANADGLRITAGASTVRGLAIGGFSGSGIRLEAGGNNVIKGNLIGLQAGSSFNPNGKGIIVASAHNTIGGTAASDRNVISANDSCGVYITGPAATGNVIQGNFVGTERDGIQARGNKDDGIIIDKKASGNVIGGTTSGAGNVISGNDHRGLTIYDASGNVVRGNKIGTQAASLSAVGNGYQGIVIAGGAHDNTIGGAARGASNVVAFNKMEGVDIGAGSVGNAISRNRIFSNLQLGINLCPNGAPCDAVTPNDSKDADTGGNNRQNFPILISALSSGGKTTIQGTLKSAARRNFVVELFVSPSCDPSGYGEGASFLAEIAAQTNATGEVGFMKDITPVVATGRAITATTTDGAGNTSEFSACVTVKTAR